MMIFLRFELAQNAPRQTHAVLVVTIYAKRKTSEARRLCNQSCLLSWVKALAKRIARDLKNGQWEHCAVYEDELKRVWPLDQKDREAKIAQFAKEYGFRLRHYKKGLCAIFDKQPRETRPGCAGKINAATAAAFVLGSFFYGDFTAASNARAKGDIDESNQFQQRTRVPSLRS
jgi:hypothetical protein